MNTETKKTKHYVNNSDFLKALVDYRDACAIAKESNKDDPQIPNYIGECFYKIADHLSRKPNFISYSFRDEMVADGIENCLMYFRNFDPDKSKNPFAYFTQIIKFAFIRRIDKEKKQHYIKVKNFENLSHQDSVDGVIQEKIELNSITQNFIKSFEERLTNRKKQVSMGNTVNKFFVEV